MRLCLRPCDGGLQLEPVDSGSEQKGEAQCSVCVCVWRWVIRRGKNLWKQSHDSWGGSMCEACLFCIYPLSAAVCTVLFPEHRNIADALTLRPPSNPWARTQGPHVHIFKETFSVLRCSLNRHDACACLLCLGREVELHVIRRTPRWRALLTG